MKRREKRIYYIVFFCVIVVLALHSLEGVMQLEEGGLLEEINRPITRKGFTNEATKTISIQESSKEEAQSRPIEEFIPKPSEEDLNVTSPYVEEKKKRLTRGHLLGLKKHQLLLLQTKTQKKIKPKKRKKLKKQSFRQFNQMDSPLQMVRLGILKNMMRQAMLFQQHLITGKN